MSTSGSVPIHERRTFTKNMKIKISGRALLISLMIKTFVDAVSRSMPMQSSVVLSSMMKRHCDRLPVALVFPLLQTRTNPIRPRLSKSRISASVDVGPSPSASTPMGPSFTSANLLHTVVVHRNRQSAAFREGTQLVFGGSVASTFTEYFHENTTVKDDHNIPTGSLVAVVVGRESSTSSKPKKDSRSKRKKIDSSDKRDDNSVEHYTFSALDESSAYRDMINQAQLIGYGVFNPESMYRVRILCHDSMHPGLTKQIRSLRKQIQQGNNQKDCMNFQLKLILERKISDSIYTRQAMGLPSPGITDTYRLVNGEGDGLSGLAVDILGGTTAIVMSSAAWCEIHKETILAVLEASLRNHPAHTETNIDIVWRNTPSRLQQDGYKVLPNTDGGTKEEKSVVAIESGVKYLTFPYSDGQKTGFYCDQRENRLMVAELCNNTRVLDLCCYNGGFALNAMIRGGAISVVGVDSSQDAIDASITNARLNGLEGRNVSFVKENIAVFMKSAFDANTEFDVIVLDPPKLAPSISSLDKASQKYHALNRDAMSLIDKNKGGLLLTCTCSAAMSQKDGGQFFLNMVNGAALSAKRRVTLLKVSGAAPCHTQSPASFPAGQYLTAALFHVGPANNI
jgi:23S rRNA G2069 N7-methylase RlmK/C1962 C5-methylase RlmI